jgi:hypothetical protein
LHNQCLAIERNPQSISVRRNVNGLGLHKRKVAIGLEAAEKGTNGEPQDGNPTVPVDDIEAKHAAIQRRPPGDRIAPIGIIADEHARRPPLHFPAQCANPDPTSRQPP